MLITFCTTPEAEFQFVKDSNLTKRHMTTFQKYELAYNLESIYEVEAEKRHQETLPKKGQKGFQRSHGIPWEHSDKHSRESATKAANEVKINPQTYQLAKFIKKHKKKGFAATFAT